MQMEEKARLLIVEDERIVAMDLRQRLQRFNYKVIDIVSTGEAAIRAVEEHKPDLVLMDIQIQGDMDGIQTSAILHKRYNTPHIYLTAHRDDDTINRAKHTEPYGYLLKPFNDMEVQTTIEMAIYKHKMRLELQLSELRFRSYIQNSSDIVVTVNTSGVIEYVSPSVDRVLGYETDEVLGERMASFLHPDDKEAVALFLKEREAGTAMDRREVRAQHADSGWVYLEIIGTAIDIDGLPKGVVLNIRDITERKRIEMELIQAKVRAEEMNRLKSTFLSNISHEIRTPLTGILGFASILESELDDQAHLDMVFNITRSGLRLLETMDAVLDLALIESARVVIENEPLRMSVEVQQAVRMLASMAVEKSIRIKVVARNEPDAMLIDRRLLGQILNNVIGNAIKFTEKGSVIITIDTLNEFNEISGERGQYVQVEVKDTGIGIEESFLPFIFDEFKQQSSGNNRKFEGTGIGLNIAKRMLGLLNARVDVQSKQGVGTTFTMKFPLTATTEA